jgi:hypothetical protein
VTAADHKAMRLAEERGGTRRSRITSRRRVVGNSHRLLVLTYELQIKLTICGPRIGGLTGGLDDDA